MMCSTIDHDKKKECNLAYSKKQFDMFQFVYNSWDLYVKR